ncbi:MAG: hypothetical protein PHX18_01805 [Candidatus Gastranaerophilales bacterium]|nr:hypothetical protein [Candidatus Gastranaerophilales bacterium]
MKKYNKKAFSLIEIMQTVILLGIIAGLSISFFRRLDTDSKLEAPTRDAIQKAVDQTIKDVCNSTVPICEAYAAPVCPDGYTHNTTADTCVSNVTTTQAECTLGVINSAGFCETPMLCNCPTTPAEYGWYITGSEVVCGRKVAQGTPCNTDETYAARKTGAGEDIYTCDIPMPVLKESLQGEACPDGNIDLSYKERINAESELCVGIFKNLNHVTPDNPEVIADCNSIATAEEKWRCQVCRAQGKLRLTNGVMLTVQGYVADQAIIKMDLDRNADTINDIKCISITKQGEIATIACP